MCVSEMRRQLRDSACVGRRRMFSVSVLLIRQRKAAEKQTYESQQNLRQWGWAMVAQMNTASRRLSVQLKRPHLSVCVSTGKELGFLISKLMKARIASVGNGPHTC